MKQQVITVNQSGEMAVDIKQAQFTHSSVFFLLLALVFTVSMGYGIVLPVLPGFLEGLPTSAGPISVSWSARRWVDGWLRLRVLARI